MGFGRCSNNCKLLVSAYEVRIDPRLSSKPPFSLFVVVEGSSEVQMVDDDGMKEKEHHCDRGIVVRVGAFSARSSSARL